MRGSRPAARAVGRAPVKDPSGDPEHRRSAAGKAEPAGNGAAARSSRYEGMRLQRADPAWPQQVQATWEAYRQARIKADQLMEAHNPTRDTWPSDDQDATAFWKAYDAVLDAEAAHEEYVAAEWNDWYSRHSMSAGPEEPEAGS
jgi:hypothetical protein